MAGNFEFAGQRQNDRRMHVLFRNGTGLTAEEVPCLELVPKRNLEMAGKLCRNFGAIAE